MTTTVKLHNYKCLIKCASSLHGNACRADTGPSSLWQPTPSSLCRRHSPPFVTRTHKWLPSYVTLRGGGGGVESDIQVKYEYFRIRDSTRVVARAKFRIHRRGVLTMLSFSPTNQIHVRLVPTSVFMSYHTLTSLSTQHYLAKWYI
jgi:hypothetical protein